ncbi:MAG: electron transfer flavoprotein subunit alpha/FixB family protein [Proteobacteria bacterium]|nr:electron transfer flavoprotein subunit alpha/FixB family protein [Pseudomonadota bacterium]MCL2307122.1 electron transfer flavoprotein subunit alpha/FixB family protein [Pseudomonadota bacterium]
MAILVLAEHVDGRLEETTHSAVTAARLLGRDVHVLVMACETQGETLSQQAASIEGVTRVWSVAAPHLETQLTEDMAAQAQALLERGGYRYALMSSSYKGKRVMPYLAALRNTDLVTDLTKIEGEDTFVRPVYAGSLLVVERLKSAVKLLSIRASAFPPSGSQTPAAPIETWEALPPRCAVRCLERRRKSALRPKLSRARIVIGCGLGVEKKDMPDIEKLADKLGAAIGVTRAVVEEGIATSDYLLGQTGKIIAPELYIAIGISGAVQHLAGIKDSKVIVAVNKDPSAPIFQIADYGIVGDVGEIVPALIELV